MTLVYFLLAIAILIFVHEMGHYLAARQCRVGVVRFSVGFGRPLLSWTSRKTGVQWVVAAIPLGGYVKMDDASFEAKSLLARSWVVFAGPLANLLFAVLAYGLVFSWGRDEPVAVLGTPPSASIAEKSGVRAGDRVLSVGGQTIRSFNDIRWEVAQATVGGGQERLILRVARQGRGEIDLEIGLQTKLSKEESADPALVMSAIGLLPFSDGVKVVRIQPASPAEKAGLRPSDRIIQINGETVYSADTVIAQIKSSAGKPVVMLVSDGKNKERVTVNPAASADGIYRMGAVVGPDIEMVRVSDDPARALWRGAVRTWEMSVLTVKALGRMILGEISWKQISGPVTIADAASTSAGLGLGAFVGFLALISVSIAVLNLLPIPVLDGGHLLYYLWEFVRGKPLPAEVQDAGRKVGIALIMGLTAVALFNDFVRLAGG